MVGYVAKDDDDSIWFHSTIPSYQKDLFGWFSISMMELPRDEYPEFQSITEPIRVELNIRVIKQ